MCLVLSKWRSMKHITNVNYSVEERNHDEKAPPNFQIECVFIMEIEPTRNPIGFSTVLPTKWNIIAPCALLLLCANYNGLCKRPWCFST